MRVLDLYCGGGGAADGYFRAGCDVVGVDIDPQPSYPYEFQQIDVLKLDRIDLLPFDLVHASPPCQGYSKAVSSTDSKYVPTRGRNEPRLIKATRDLLIDSGVPYVIENVRDAKPFLHEPICLCGVMFGRPMSRHRWFESSFYLEAPEHPACRGVAKRYAEAKGWDYRDMSMTGKGRHAGTMERWQEISGIIRPMRQHDFSEAILPAYAEWIGTRFREYVKRAAA